MARLLRVHPTLANLALVPRTYTESLMVPYDPSSQASDAPHLTYKPACVPTPTQRHMGIIKNNNQLLKV